MTFPPYHTSWYNRPISMTELQFALFSCSSRAPGPDQLPYVILHKIPLSQLPALLSFSNYIFATGHPHQWREATVIPLLKPRKPGTDKTSYRPIALTSCLGKLLEKIVNRRVQRYLELSSFFTTTQSGFRSAHSTLDGLSRLEHSAHLALQEHHFYVATFLDIAAAFDTIWHHGLLLKLKQVGLCGLLPDFIKNILHLRRIRLRISGHLTSSSYPLCSGVPQGSVLSPTLFTIFINDIFDALPRTISTSLYAEDGALWASSNTLASALSVLQEALHTVGGWSQSWGLTICSSTERCLFVCCSCSPSSGFY